MKFDNNALTALKAGARTKHLFMSRSNRLYRKLHSALFPTENKVDYQLPQPSGVIPREFIRQEPWEIEYLFMLARRCKTGIVETGRYNGGSVLVFASANKDVPIHSVDIAPRDDERLRRMLDKLGIGKNVSLIVGDSQHTKYPEVGAVDLLFVDGDHSYDGCMADLENWWPNVEVGGHVVLHDSYFGNPVQDATIDFISRHPVEVVLQPYNLYEHRRSPTGSLCHFIKRG